MDEFLEDFTDEAIEIASESVEAFRRNIERAGLELTDELKRDFQFHVLRQVNLLTMEFDFREYGRFKDMSLLRYSSHIPPIDAMEFFVDKIGLDKFAYVEGYQGKQVPTVKNATRRIAWAIAMGRRRVPSVKRDYRGTWYNDGKMKIINAAKQRVRWRASEWIAFNLKKKIETADL
ncbi:hypothetical protein GO730_20990 [Spirosoma sp. HMF3257]|uniref:HK97 gp10 family phage protein n=1 Tax=Spirosoma telluris TaxID=2183553 RepID=A0A327NMU9_9BACT|nr:hypothetical protein [Spirosoma telluris]RAI76025.1 hypothetical protein HMF3257_20915 [Spirosoma telluris]